MATKVVMEALSPTMEEGRLVKWLKNEGDAVKAGDVLAEVETDKAVMELVARGDGVIRKRIASEGEASPVGTLLAVIATPDENIDSIVSSAGGNGAKASPNAAVAQTTETPPASPVPQTPQQSQGEASAPPQQKTAAAPAAPPAAAPAAPPAPPAAPQGDGRRPRSSPLARRLASEKGIELSQVQGSGPGGRIIKKDIETAQARPAAAQAQPAAAQAQKKEAPKRFITRDGDYQDIPLSQIRKTIARRLAESIGPVPTFYLTAEFDAEKASSLRNELKEFGDDYKISFNDIVIKAVANALSEHPEANAHWNSDHIRYFNRVHIGVAVAIEDGLITPVVFDADRKTISQISAEVKQLAGLARNRRLTPEQYTGSTFSVSNLGMFGIDQFTAIINPPEAGILAIGGVEAKPVVIDGEIQVRQRMRVTMSCDHRVIDGATGAKFLQTVKQFFENPLLLMV
ncbi:MAG TPA: pyruvate dehydrogenase complex dihydrolipoamide acetyltransferase [Gemmatimonadaceae bacterium]|nr:pyruvate dehydrogenase complex dihydrolipoamide acetyltransferase [Gemmatimonadaceae bacterium]